MTFKEAVDNGFIQALLDGKTLQQFNMVKDHNDDDWLDLTASSVLAILTVKTAELIRIKPCPKRVPLTAEDLPPVFWVKFAGDDWKFPTIIGLNGITVSTEYRTFSELTKINVVWSTDRRVEHPFWKEVEG